jgi:hypothetical protein
MTLGRKNCSVTRTDGGADVFRLAGFLRDDNLISHNGSFGRIDSTAASLEHIVNMVSSQARLLTASSQRQCSAPYVPLIVSRRPMTLVELLTIIFPPGQPNRPTPDPMLSKGAGPTGAAIGL